jgi:hypothetical protein
MKHRQPVFLHPTAEGGALQVRGSNCANLPSLP